MALEELDRAAALDPNDSLVVGMRGMAFAVMGDRVAALEQARRASDLAASRPYPLADYAVACIHAQIGSPDDAFRFLDRALRTKALSLSAFISPAYIRDDPALARLRNDPRFVKLVGSD